jgi:trans-aconitate methyltransferase
MVHLWGGAPGYCRLSPPLVPMEFLRKYRLPSKFVLLDRYVGNKPFRLLDIGAGNHSATVTHQWYPQVEYYGLDLDRNYNNDERDFQLTKAFYEMNLENLEFDAIPDGFFDVILMNHVIEHLRNGDEVVARLLPKLRAGGLFYLEFPGPRSTTLPRMRGTLNFFDDDTHMRVYSRPELYNVAPLAHHCPHSL